MYIIQAIGAGLQRAGPGGAGDEAEEEGGEQNMGNDFDVFQAGSDSQICCLEGSCSLPTREQGWKPEDQVMGAV